MIKSLFDHDEEPQPKENKSEIETEEAIKRQLDELNLQPDTPAAVSDESETITQIRPAETGAAWIIDEDDEIETIALPRIEQVYANAGEPAVDNAFPENRFFEAEATETRAPETESPPMETEPMFQVSTPTPYRNVLQNEDAPVNESVSQTENAAQSLTTAETLRQSGMAWSAAIGLFGSVLFMMILGWFFDLLTGASPVGIVGGIIIGAGIGFYQFFRTTSQIFKK
jgi:F0F1-type ATP synthase assembly protein I